MTSILETPQNRIGISDLETSDLAVTMAGMTGHDRPEYAATMAQHNLAYFNGAYYRQHFDPDPNLNQESGLGDIGDDLLDTYKDIKAGCVLFERGQVSDALWFWSFLHRNHWGRHAVGALFALHCLFIAK